MRGEEKGEQSRGGRAGIMVGTGMRVRVGGTRQRAMRDEPEAPSERICRPEGRGKAAVSRGDGPPNFALRPGRRPCRSAQRAAPCPAAGLPARHHKNQARQTADQPGAGLPTRGDLLQRLIEVHVIASVKDDVTGVRRNCFPAEESSWSRGTLATRTICPARKRRLAAIHPLAELGSVNATGDAAPVWFDSVACPAMSRNGAYSSMVRADRS